MARNKIKDKDSYSASFNKSTLCSLKVVIAANFFFHKSYNFVVHTFTFLNIRSEACPGFILGGAETIFWAGRIHKRGGGRKRKREKHLIIENRGRARN